VVELQQPVFDGEILQGRFLIGARGGEVVVPADLAAHAWVIVEDLIECGTDRSFSISFLDPILVNGQEPTRILAPDHWYGADFRIEVRHPKQRVEVLPACVEVKLAYLPPPSWPLKLSPPVRFSVQVSPSQPSGDGGVGGPSPGDAG
jgi:hypothetical protein